MKFLVALALYLSWAYQSAPSIQQSSSTKVAGSVVRYEAQMSTRTSQADLILKLKGEGEIKYIRLRHAPDGFGFDAPPANRDRLLPKPRLCHSAPFVVAQAATAENAKQQQGDVADEAPLPQDSKQLEARLAKNRRYNGGRCHLTAGQDCFFEITEPWSLPEIPLEKSAIAFVGTVSRVQPYLSEDGTRIYTETTFRVEELFKRPTTFTLTSDSSLVIDRMGGAIKTRSGQILHDGTRNGFLGRPQGGMRYVLFADSIHGGKDFSMLRGYELRDGKVFRLTEDGSPSNVLVSDLSQEQTFLQAVRSRANESRSSLSGVSDDSIDPTTGNLRMTIPLVATAKPSH